MAEEHFGKTLLKYRKDHYLTQRQLADLIGVSANHIGTLEHEKKTPRSSTIAAFEDAIKQKAEYDEANPETVETTDRITYNQIWKGLDGIEPECRREILDTFRRILDWL